MLLRTQRWKTPIQPALRGHFDYGEGDFPAAESRAREQLSLPMYPELDREQTDAVAATIAEALRIVA